MPTGQLQPFDRLQPAKPGEQRKVFDEKVGVLEEQERAQVQKDGDDEVCARFFRRAFAVFAHEKAENISDEDGKEHHDDVLQARPTRKR